MFRVRKVARRKSSPGKASPRARMQDFQLAARRLRRRRQNAHASAYPLAKTLVREARAPRGALAKLDALKANRAFAIVAPLSEHVAMPSMAETLRVLVAMRLREMLEARAIGPCVLTLWPGIPAELDVMPRFTIGRDGRAESTLFTQQDRENDVQRITETLAVTEFTPWLAGALEQTWHADPAVWKLRLLFALVIDKRGVAFPADVIELKQTKRPMTPRASYRARLSRLLEQVPVLSVVHPTSGETAPIDVQIADAYSGEVIPFASNSVTMIENKIERWLTKYGVAPEELLDEKVHLTRLVNGIIPSEPERAVAATREQLLGKLFALEHQLDDAGYEKQSTKVLDRLANQVDAQFDKLKHSAKSVEQRERKTAFDQLTKARGYLMPNNFAQSEAMSLLHYLNFYGPSFVEDLKESIEIGDGRHHLLFVGE